MPLPVGGTYTMIDKEAAELSNQTKPDFVISTRYGDIVGKIENAQNLTKLVTFPTEVLIQH